MPLWSINRACHQTPHPWNPAALSRQASIAQHRLCAYSAASGWVPHNQRAHQAGMIAAIDSGKFQGQLIGRIKPPASAVVTAQQGILTRTDDELVPGGNLPALRPPLHGSQNIAFIRTGTGHVYGSIQCLVRQLGSPFNIAEFARALAMRILAVSSETSTVGRTRPMSCARHPSGGGQSDCSSSIPRAESCHPGHGAGP
ncbi:MAG: hypothetical protein Ct9H300mP16_19680 [Pseudomonadota bacterium]|nr:MAG: hypothetical protein Ct9H300mP16_19680 [Pseudomonadota bacterium]